MVDCNVLIISQRERPDGYGRQPGYTSLVEAENVLATCTGADFSMIARSPNHPAVRVRRLATRKIRRVTGTEAELAGPLANTAGGGRARAPKPPKVHYDIAVFIGYTMWDLALLRHHLAGEVVADRMVAWFPESWASEFADGRLDYEPFRVADAIFVGMEAAANKLRTIAPCPVDYLPPAVDTLVFGAAPPDGPRPIDVLGIGRQEPQLHAALLDWSRKAGKLYVYDTLSGAKVNDVPAHRGNLGDTYRRTNVALTNFAKYNLPEVIQDEREIPGRVWEGLASGVTMAGRPPDERLQHHLIGESVVLDLPADASAAVELIDHLHQRPDEALRWHHTQLALRQHDWIHRWAQIFASVDLPLPSSMQARIDRLAAMSSAAAAG